MDSMNPTSGVPSGWQCPLCSKVWGPQVESCSCNDKNALRKRTEETGGDSLKKRIRFGSIDFGDEEIFLSLK